MTDWPIKTLGEVCELSTGGTPSTGNKSYYDGGQIKWLRSGDVQQREIHDCDGRITEEGMRNANTRFLPLNSVLIALAGQGKTRGTVAMLRTKATCNQSVVSIMPVNTKTLVPEFVFWNLHMKYDEIRRMTGDDGNDRRGLNMRLIRSMTIPLAPLEEQKRIVALLDAATARVTELTSCYEQARTHASNLFTKSLDMVMFKDESSHVESALKHLTTKIGSGATPTGGQESYKTTGVPLIRSMNVHDSEFDLKGLAYIDSQQAQKLDGATVEEGDVLLNITGASLTRTCIVPSNLVPARVNQHVSILRVKPELINEHYLQLFLLCARTKSLLWEIGGAAGSTRQALTKKDLEELVVKYPLALKAQYVIVEEANKLASAVSEFVGLIDAKLTAAKNLRQSILEAAFAGEL